MNFQLALTLQAIWTAVCHAAMQHYPAAWGHYDVCKSQIYSDDGLTWDYMACQPEAADMTQYLKVSLDPPNITCGDPPETYCALVSTETVRKKPLFLSVAECIFLTRSDLRGMTDAPQSLRDSDMSCRGGTSSFVAVDVTLCRLKSWLNTCVCVCILQTLMSQKTIELKLIRVTLNCSFSVVGFQK